jgi:hypothetical protein
VRQVQFRGDSLYLGLDSRQLFAAAGNQGFQPFKDAMDAGTLGAEDF